MYEIFAELLKERDVTPYRVHKETGIAQSTLSDWKRGKSVPSAENMIKIAEFFDVSVDYLLGVSDVKNPPPQNEREVLLNALFDGDKSVTEDMMDEVKGFARYVWEREKNKKKDE